MTVTVRSLFRKLTSRSFIDIENDADNRVYMGRSTARR